MCLRGYIGTRRVAVDREVAHQEAEKPFPVGAVEQLRRS
jgi:hypothetical protein